MKRFCIYLVIFFMPVSVAGQSAVDSLKNLLETENDSVKVQILLSLSRLYISKNLLESVDYANSALELAKETGNLFLQKEALVNLGAARYYQGNFEKARDAWLEGIDIIKQMEKLSEDDSINVKKIRESLALLYNNVGVVYKNEGEYDKAIEYYQQNLRISEESGNILNMARSHNNIGNVYFYFGIDYNKAIDYYNTALELFRQHAEDTSSNYQEKSFGLTGMANAYLNIGLVYKALKNMGYAIDNFRKALRIFRELDDKPGIANTENQMGLVYLEGGSYEEALKASTNALTIYREIGQRKEVAATLNNMGLIYYRWGRYELALEYFNQSLNLSKELNLKREVYDNYKDISNTYSAMGSYRLALQNYQKYNELKDSFLREESIRQISELETKYETERVERENELLNTQNELLNIQNVLQETELRRQRVLIWSLVGIFAIILASSILLFLAYRTIKKTNILLEKQNIEIKNQRDQIFQQKQEITDSIQYASRIQNAILPPESLLDKLSDHFIFYKPRDIVSGDYYWMTQKDGNTVVVAADCTGHGVPGAFMSMLGISFMNEIVNKSDITQPSEILNKLRENVVNSLHQTGVEGEAQDGMDLSLCIINHKKTKLHYAGAYNPLYLIRDDNLTEYKADKMPIGIYKDKNDSFTNHEIDLKNEDALYMFTDGYVDQFGGPTAKKFMAKRLKELLLKIYKKPMKEQKEILSNLLSEWQGRIYQVDDILVMGIRI